MKSDIDPNDPTLAVRCREAEKERDELRALTTHMRERLLPALDAAGVRYDDPPEALAGWIRAQEERLDRVAGELNKARRLLQESKAHSNHMYLRLMPALAAAGAHFNDPPDALEERILAEHVRIDRLSVALTEARAEIARLAGS